MSCAVMHGNPLEELKGLPGKCLPIQPCHIEIVAQVCATLDPGSKGPERILKLFLVAPNGYVYVVGSQLEQQALPHESSRKSFTCTKKVLQPPCMVTVKMAQDNCFDIANLPSAGSFDRLWQTMDRFVPDSRGTFHGFRAPAPDNILAGSSVEKNQTNLGMEDQGGNHDQVASLVRLRG